jgi:hypothetical protein
MRNNYSRYLPSFSRMGKTNSTLLPKLFIFLFICTICVLSTLNLQAAPTAHAVCKPGADTVDQPANCPTSGHKTPTPTTKPQGFASVYIYATEVNVHWDNACKTPKVSCQVKAMVNPGTYKALCQKAGESVSDLGYTNKWWTDMQAPNGYWGWVTNIYIQGDVKIAGVPDCTF